MNAYFVNITKEERENILDKHKNVYDGYVTNYVQPEQQPLYVQDFANDKDGVTISNKGVVKHYTNMNINEDVYSGAGFEPDNVQYEEEMDEQLDMIGDGEDDLTHGTFDDDDIDFEDFDIIDLADIDEEVKEPLKESVNKTLDMFRRFKNY
jgi:hypothetical protein